MDLSVIIVNWNSKELLKKCLESIFLFTDEVNFEVIVVDNASTDGSTKMIKENFPTIKLIENKENFGFAKGNNIGYNYSHGRYILLLNQDTEFVENSLKEMLAFMNKSKQVDILGVKLLNSDLTLQPSCRSFPTLLSQILILLKVHNAFSKIYPVKKYYMLDFDYEKEMQVDQVMGAALLVRRDIVDKLKMLFDEGYWFWFEEVDLCRRVKNIGGQVIYSPITKIIHHKGVSQVALAKRQKNFNKSLFRYFKKFHPWWQYYILCLFYPISIVLSYLLPGFLKIIPLKKKRYL